MFVVTDCTMQVGGDGFEPVEKHCFDTAKEVGDFVESVSDAYWGWTIESQAKCVRPGDCFIFRVGIIIDCIQDEEKGQYV